MLTACCYNLEWNSRLAEARLKNAAQTNVVSGHNAGNKMIIGPSHLVEVQTYRKACMGCGYCIVCYTQLSLDFGTCKHCVIPHDPLLNEVRIACHNAIPSSDNQHVDEVFEGQKLPSVVRLVQRFIESLPTIQISQGDKMRADNATWTSSTTSQTTSSGLMLQRYLKLTKDTIMHDM